MSSYKGTAFDRVAAIQETLAAAAEDALRGDDEAQEEDDVVDIVEVERLQTLGVPASDIKKLKLAGIHTVAGVLMQSSKTLNSIHGLNEVRIKRITDACAKLNPTTFLSGTELLAKRNSVVKMTTGAKALDGLLGGGIESASITEVFGEFRSGKTQLAHTLCVTAQLPKDIHGGNGKVAYIDTDGTFRPERIIPIAERFGIDPMSALENVVCARAFTHEQQSALINEIAARMAEDQFALLIVDSFTALFRVDFLGREELAARQQAIASMMNKLTKLATEFNIAVFITNQVMSDPSGGASSTFLNGETKKAVGGHVLAHASTTRLALRKGLGERRICKVFESPYLPEFEASFAISSEGIIDLAGNTE